MHFNAFLNAFKGQARCSGSQPGARPVAQGCCSGVEVPAVRWLRSLPCAQKPLGEKARPKGRLGSPPTAVLDHWGVYLVGGAAKSTAAIRCTGGEKKCARGLGARVAGARVGAHGGVCLALTAKAPPQPGPGSRATPGGHPLTSLLFLALAKPPGQVWATATEDEEGQIWQQLWQQRLK